MNNFSATVKIELLPNGLFRAIVSRNKVSDGRVVNFLEWVGESVEEKVLRRTLKRYGYPSTKALVPVAR